MTRPRVRVTSLVISVAVVLAFGGLYVAEHPGGRSPDLGPTALAAAPASAHQATRRPAGPVGRAMPPTVSAAWVATFAARTGIPARALTAYADASLRAPCPLGWTTLAAIGWVESGHGTVDGQQIDADGRTVAPILGPVLDGRGRVAAVPGAGGGWARATGPMQFLDSTWAQWGSDGDGDGVADPQDLDDAAYAAARYLCASGQDLSTGAGWDAAIRSYNHSDAYVRAVFAAASAYAAR